MPKKGYVQTERHRKNSRIAQLNRWKRDKNSKAMKLRNKKISKANKANKANKGSTQIAKCYHNRTILTEEGEQRLIKLRREHMLPICALAKRFNISLKQARRILKEVGLDKRRYKGWYYSGGEYGS